MITLPADWANYGNIIKDFSKKYGIKVNSENPDGTSADEIEAVQSEKGSHPPDVLDIGPSSLCRLRRRSACAVQGGELERDPLECQGGQRRLVLRLRRVRVNRIRLKSGQDAAHVLCRPTQADLQEPGRTERQPDAGRRRVRRRLRGGPRQGGSFNDICPESSTSRSWRPRATSCPVTGGPSTVKSGADAES